MVEKIAIPPFMPSHVLPGNEWKAEVIKKHQEIQDECMANNQPKKIDTPNHPFV